MTTRREAFTLIQEAMQALGPLYQDVTNATFEDHNMNGRDWYACALALGLAPEPISANLVNTLMPYDSLERDQAWLAEVAEHGFLTGAGDHAYHLSEKGSRAITGFFTNAQQALGEVALPGVNVTRLNELLARLIEEIARAAEPADKPMFFISRKTDTGSLPLLARLDQFLTDLYRFRDDVHIPAWQRYGVSGPVWEAFSFVWEDRVDGLAERMERRGFGPEQVEQMLAELVARGWIEVDGDGYRVTEAGGKLRQEAEDETDRLYFGPWAVLTDHEINELGGLLAALRDALNALTAAKEAEAVAE